MSDAALDLHSDTPVGERCLGYIAALP